MSYTQCLLASYDKEYHHNYLVEQQVQGAIAHKLCDYAEELWLVADAKDLDDVVESGFVEHLCLLQKAVPLSET